MQPKLEVNAAHDRYEMEADAIADQVMRIPLVQRQIEPDDEEEEEPLQTKPLTQQITSLVQRQVEPEEEEEEEPLQAKPLSKQITPLVQRQVEPEEEEEELIQPKSVSSIEPLRVQRQAENEEEEPVQTKSIRNENTAQLRRQPEEEEEELLQTKADIGQTPRLSHKAAADIQGLRGSGQPLDAATRAFMEPRFGRDFSQVRMHTGNRAVNLARSINARAFTVGRDVVMGAEGYSSAAGRKLLAHELTHVVQQNPEHLVKKKVSTPGSRLKINCSPARKIRRSRAVFVSTHGRQGYLQWGALFHRQHGYPAAQNVSSVEEMLEHMARMRRPIQQVRILTHAVPQGIFLPLLRGGGTTLFQQDMSLSRRFELQQELGTSHPTVRRRGRYVVINAYHHLMPQNWVGHTWQHLYNNSTPAHHNLLSRIGLTRRPNPMTELHNFFWWVIDREILQMREQRGEGQRVRMVHVIPMNRRHRRQLLAAYNTNVNLFRNRVIAGPFSHGIPLDVARRAPPVTRAPMSAACAQQLENAIAAGARVVFGQRRQGLRGARFALPNQRYRSIQGALARGTYSSNLLRVKYLIPNGGAIEIRGCSIGQNRAWLESFRDFLGHGQGASRSRPHVSAPRLRHVYHRRFRVIRRRGRRRRQYFGPVTEHLEFVVRRRRRRRVIRIGPSDPRFAANIVHVR